MTVSNPITVTIPAVFPSDVVSIVLFKFRAATREGYLVRNPALVGFGVGIGWNSTYIAQGRR